MGNTQAGAYMILPTTFEPGQEATFTFRLESSTKSAIVTIILGFWIILKLRSKITTKSVIVKICVNFR